MAKIDGFLVKLGFTKSDADSNLYYKVVEGDTIDIGQPSLMYVDDLFLTGDDRLVSWCKKQAHMARVRDEGSRIDALLSRSGDMAEAWMQYW